MDETVPAIVDAWYPGESCGSAMADVLFGDYNPAGRLPFTSYKLVGNHLPMNDYEVLKGKTNKYYVDEPLYSFGYGLSFSSFEYRKMSVSQSDEWISISINLENAGEFDSNEVAQLYERDVKL